MKAVTRDKELVTFYLADRLYGMDVTEVQEVTGALPITTIRLAPEYVKGLINLRGQIATAIGLRELFGLEPNREHDKNMAVVCRRDAQLISFQVDKIGEVVKVAEADFEPAPNTIPERLKKFVVGVYKIEGSILSVVEINKISNELTVGSKSESF